LKIVHFMLPARLNRTAEQGIVPDLLCGKDARRAHEQGESFVIPSRAGDSYEQSLVTCPRCRALYDRS
jgi:hypothetical protein